MRTKYITALCAVVAFLAAARAAPAQAETQWQADDDDKYCTIKRLYTDQDVMIVFMQDLALYESNNIVISAFSRNWKIEQGDQLGEVGFHTRKLSFFEDEEIESIQYGFLIITSTSYLPAWIDGTASDGFWIESGDMDLGKFEAGNLKGAFGELMECAEHRFAGLQENVDVTLRYMEFYKREIERCGGIDAPGLSDCMGWPDE